MLLHSCGLDKSREYPDSSRDVAYSVEVGGRDVPRLQNPPWRSACAHGAGGTGGAGTLTVNTVRPAGQEHASTGHQWNIGQSGVGSDNRVTRLPGARSGAGQRQFER